MILFAIDLSRLSRVKYFFLYPKMCVEKEIYDQQFFLLTLLGMIPYMKNFVRQKWALLLWNSSRGLAPI